MGKPNLKLLRGLSLDPWGEPWCRGYNPWDGSDANPTFLQPDRRKIAAARRTKLSTAEDLRQGPRLGRGLRL